MKKLLALILALAVACGMVSLGAAEEQKTFTIGICNYVDDASLNQIIQNASERLEEIGKERGVTFVIRVENCNTDASVMQQIITNFMSDGVDLMIAVATPVALTMQGMTQDAEKPIPVVFAAVSDPVGANLVESLEHPGANMTGTSDYLNTEAVLNLIFAVNPDAKKIALLYDPAQDASTAPINAAKAFLAERGVEVKEYTGSNASEVMMAADSIVADEMDAVFTPTDNTIMSAELAIYETLAGAMIPHYCGADSFALNGAFIGYGVDYALLGRETGDMAAAILLDGADPASLPVRTFDNGVATINTETCAALGLDIEAVKKACEPYCTQIRETVTKESFD